MKRRLLLLLVLFSIVPVVGFYDNSKDAAVLASKKKTGQVKGAKTVAETALRDLVTREGRQDDYIIAKRGPSRVDVYYSKSRVKDPAQMLEAENIIVFPEDHVDFFPDPKLGMGSKITVDRATAVLVNDNGKTATYRTWGKTVGDFIQEKELDVSQYDIINPDRSALIKEGMEIVIDRASDDKQVEHIYAPFNVIVKDDPWLPNGKVKIQQVGQLGDRELVWRVVNRYGGELKRELVEDKIVNAPVDKIVLRGTKAVSFQGPFMDWITEAAAKYGANAGQMYRVMMCESGGDPYALSAHGKYKGLFQYDNRTWSVSGFGDKDIFDPQAQINAAAKAWSGRYTKWPVTSRICGDLGK